MKNIRRVITQLSFSLILSIFAFSSNTLAAHRISTIHLPGSYAQGSGEISLGSIDYMPQGFSYNDAEKTFCSKYEINNPPGEYPRKKQVKTCLNVNEIAEYSNIKEANKDVYHGSRYYLDDTIPSYIKRAFINESKFIGYKIKKKSKKIVNITILNLLLDFSKSNTHRVLTELKFTVFDSETDKNIFEEDMKGEFVFGKGEHIDITNAIFAATTRSIENFVMSAQASGVLGR